MNHDHKGYAGRTLVLTEKGWAALGYDPLTWLPIVEPRRNENGEWELRRAGEIDA